VLTKDDYSSGVVTPKPTRTRISRGLRRLEPTQFVKYSKKSPRQSVAPDGLAAMLADGSIANRAGPGRDGVCVVLLALDYFYFPSGAFVPSAPLSFPFALLPQSLFPRNASGTPGTARPKFLKHGERPRYVATAPGRPTSWDTRPPTCPLTASRLRSSTSSLRIKCVFSAVWVEKRKRLRGRGLGAGFRRGTRRLVWLETIKGGKKRGPTRKSYTLAINKKKEK